MYRLARDRPIEDIFAEHGLDASAGTEIVADLVEFGYALNERELLDTPFRPKRKRNPTRFSDGSFPVFYSSLDSDTAEAEVRHWTPTFMGRPGRPRTAYFRLFRCTFEGLEKDLRPHIGAWPNLVHDSDYTFCNQVGAEAVELGLDGLVTWSARRAQGANLPVFSRPSLRDPETGGLIALTYDPATGSVSVRPASE